MVTESTNGSRFWLHPAAWGLVLILLCGGPVRADEVADIYQRLQSSPQSVPLNLQYARAAEKAGKLKWALPAYERALSADPDNREARTGIDRITSKLRAEADRP
jgi:predicted TPR repeat methyltransferase